MRQWRRVHRILGGSIAAFIVGTAVLVAAPVVLLATPTTEGGVALVVTGAVLLVGSAIRKSFAGVYIGDYGIMIRRTFSTDSFAWTDIAAMEVRTSSHAKELGEPWPSLWIVTGAGDVIETPVIRGNYWMAPQPSLVGRRMPPEGLYLVDHIFDAVVATLKAEYADRTKAPR